MMEKDNRELTLFDFMIMCYHKFVQLLKWLVCALMKTVRLGLQYFWVVIICAVLGFFAGWLSSKPFASRYEAQATIFFSRGMKPTVADALNSFMASEITTKEQFGIEPELQFSVYKFKISDFIDYKNDGNADDIDYNRTVNRGDTSLTVMDDRIRLTLGMKRHYDFTKWEKAFVDYAHSLPAVVRADSVCKNMACDRLKYFEREIQRLDSLATKEYCSAPDYGKISPIGNYIVIKEKNQQLYYSHLQKAMALYDCEKLQIANAPDIINFQTPFIVGGIPPIWKMAIGLAVGVVFGLIMALCVKYRKIIFEFLKQK